MNPPSPRPRPRHRHHAHSAILPLLSFVWLLGCTPEGHLERPTNELDYQIDERRLPGEFEHVKELLLSWDPELELFLLDVVVSAVGQAPITISVGQYDTVERVTELLDGFEISPSDVRVVAVPNDSIWVRDYGPQVVRGRNGDAAAIDVRYIGSDDDDEFAQRAAHELLGLPVHTSKLVLEGGNFLSDGTGRCVTTTLALQQQSFEYSEPELRTVLRELYGCKRTTIVPMLHGEQTGHVDMFVTIVGPGRALVGWYDPEDDRDNSALLDQTADMLAADGFAVRRIPMGANDDDVFRSFTNGVAVNGAVLVPVYPERPAGEREALAIFAEEYPGRDIVPVVSSEPILLGGAVHCATLGVMQ